MVHCILYSRYPAAEENMDLLQGGRFKKSVMKMIKEGTKSAGAPVGVKTQSELYDKGMKAYKSQKGRGDDDDQEGAGRSRLSAEFQKAMKQ